MLTRTPQFVDSGYETVTAAHQFKQDLLRSLPSLPRMEVMHMANKIITVVNDSEGKDQDTYYREVLELVEEYYRSSENPTLFHAVIGAYIDTAIREKHMQENNSISAWMSLDEIAMMLMSAKQVLFDNTQVLSTRERRVEKAINDIIIGVQIRKTGTIREGLKGDSILNPHIEGDIDKHLWNIERRLH